MGDDLIKDEIIKEQLKGFDAVWRRVKSSKKNVQRTAQDCGMKLMPNKNKRKPNGR